MNAGDIFVGQELHDLSRHLVLYPRLSRLVLVGDGTAGYPNPSGQSLIDHTGAEHAIGNREGLRIAHPLDPLERGDWHDWQRDCLQRQTAQPFKQLFRELCVPTRDERDSLTSRRYAGHQLQSRQALALLGRRGWHVHPEEGVRKTFHRENLTAAITFLGLTYTAADVEGLTMEDVCFFDTSSTTVTPISGVPGRLFSEVMRDLDLVVSVAHAGSVDPEASASTIEMRSTLVTETADLLSLDNVRVEQPWILIDGKLGDWSIHLGSANVHRRPGGAVCIIPVHGQHRGRVFLPFADDDPRTAEVVAKTLLLARDHEIKDPTILEQLRA